MDARARLQGLLTMLAASKNVIPRRLSILLTAEEYADLELRAREERTSKNAIVKRGLKLVRDTRKRLDAECCGENGEGK